MDCAPSFAAFLSGAVLGAGFVAGMLGAFGAWYWIRREARGE